MQEEFVLFILGKPHYASFMLFFYVLIISVTRNIILPLSYRV